MRWPLVIAVLTATPAAAGPCLDQAQLGTLTICTTAYAAPSHGGESTLLIAHAIVDNHGTSPVRLDLLDLAVVDDAGAATWLGDLAWSLDGFHGGHSAMIPAGGHVELAIDGRAQLSGFRYHVHYHHAIELRAGTGAALVRAGDLYFRHPRR